MKINNQNLRPLMLPISLVVVMLVVLLVVTNMLLSRISATEDQINMLTSETTALNEKLEVLKQVDQTIQEGADKAYIALPSSNPATTILAQVRKLANENEVVLGQLEMFSSTSPVDSVPKIAISFEASGSVDAVIELLRKLRTIAPLVNVATVELNSASDTATTDIELEGFWADLPTTLPTLTDNAPQMSGEELGTLATLETLTLPEFTQPIAPTTDIVERESPFLIAE